MYSKYILYIYENVIIKPIFMSNIIQHYPLRKNLHHFHISCMCLQESVREAGDFGEPLKLHLIFQQILPAIWIQFCLNCTWPQGIGVVLEFIGWEKAKKKYTHLCNHREANVH